MLACLAVLTAVRASRQIDASDLMVCDNRTGSVTMAEITTLPEQAVISRRIT
jgi:hypothetical protein